MILKEFKLNINRMVYILRLKVEQPEIGFNNEPLNLRELYSKACAKLESEEHKQNLYNDSGFDLYTPVPLTDVEKADYTIPPGKIHIINLRVKCAVSELKSEYASYFGVRELEVPSPYFIYPRSSISKRGLMLANSVGIIDCGYRGNLMAALYNTTDEPITLKPGDRLLQICLPTLSNYFVAHVVDSLDETERGEAGLGSTGN